MTYALNESHALYPFLHELIGVKNGALVSLKTARTFTKHADATYGAGAYGEHFKSLADGYTARGASISPAVALSTIANPNMTLVVVVNSVTSASNSAQFIEGTTHAPTLNAQGGKLGASADYTLVGAQGTVTVTGTTPHFLSLVRVGQTSYEARVNGTLSASGGHLTWDNAGPAWPYIGGTPGFGSVTAEFVWAAWFTKALTTQELSDLRASLGANNAFALVQAGPATPVAFAGSVTNQTGTEGAAFSLNLSTYFSGSETPFAYSVQAGTLPAGLSLNSSTGVISGTPTTAGVSSGIVIRATDATPDTADTNSFSITINAAGDASPPTLTGTVTFTSITQTSYTANWPAGLDNVAVTGYEYQIGSTAGAWTDAGNNLSAAITGRTAGITETVYVRAYDAAGLRSTPAISGGVTLESVLAAGINVTDPLKNNTGTVLASQSGVRVAVLQAADLVSVFETSGLTTNASGVLGTISAAAITTGQQYHVAIKLADGSVGITGPITAS